LSEGGTVALTLRRLDVSDSFAHLTALLHRAYAPLAASGLRFLATHQSEEVTRERCNSGVCFVAELDSCVVGTVTYYPPSATKGSPWLDRPDVASFGQLGVEPKLRGQKIGHGLVAAVEQQARIDGAVELALDTALAARHLVTWYERLGYRRIEIVSWPVTNYRSVIMSKTLVVPGLAKGGGSRRPE
jgi:GNAT superfamily N-acetyltransferase